MHANKREEISEVWAGDIAAAVGLKNVTTGDTICDPKNPVMLEAMSFPEPVIAVSIEPKTKADQEKLGMALGKLMQEDPTFRVHTDQDTGQTLIAGMGELHLEIITDRLVREFNVGANVGKPQVAYKETITQEAEGEGRFVRQTGGRGQYGHAKIRMRPTTEADFVFNNKIVGGVDPQGVHQADRAGHQGGAGDRSARGLPVHRRRGRPLRRQLPRRRLLRNRVQDRRLDGVPGRLQAGAPGADGADHGGRGRHARGVHGRGHRRHHLAPRPDPEHGGARQRPGDHLQGAAVGDVRLRDRPALAVAGARQLHMQFAAYEQAPKNVSEEVVAKAAG